MKLKRLFVLTLGAAAAVVVAGCGSSASDAADAPLDPQSAAPVAEARRDAAAPVVRRDASPAPVARPRPPAEPAGPTYREVTIPAGTTLPLSLTSGLASDTSAVEDAVSAELTHAITIAGRDVLPAGARLDGTVTQVDDSNRVKGRAMIAFSFTSVRTAGMQYDLQSELVSHRAEATKSEDATKIGVGAGAGAIIGGILGGKKGAAQGAVVGGGAGTGVVLATKGREVRLAPGADVTTQLTSPLTVRVRIG